jgi:hypothetical protein
MAADDYFDFYDYYDQEYWIDNNDPTEDSMSATNPAEETLRLLRSIDTSLKQLLAQGLRGGASAPAATQKAVASDSDLDGKYGNPELRFLPRDWTGPSFKGRKFSECPPALLDLVADSCEYIARKADENNELTDKGKPVGDYKRMDAARARGWAARIRSGKTVQTTPATPPANGNGSTAVPGWAAESEW